MSKPLSDKEKLDEVMNLIMTHNCDGGHHKQYLIDQIVRTIQGDNYEKWRYDFEYGDGQGGHYPDKFYSWDEGIP